ncbi:hypothetical protein CMI42_00520 [Candidatus Pacearchaeota archaeon]|nr:hypothetical protein [Candidatus Pacearchaeota archaeon]
MRKILFICLGNRFRSRIAEEYFNKTNKNKKIKSSSAGLVYANPISKNTVKTVKKYGINIGGGTPKRIKENDLKNVDKVIVVADNVPISILKIFSKNVISWNIRDTDGGNQNKVENIVKNIIKKVDVLIKKILREGVK